MGCPNGELLSAYFDQEIEPPFADRVAEHVAGCRRCAAQLARLQSLRARLLAEADPQCGQARARTLRGLAQRQRPPARRLWAATKATVTLPWPAAAAVLAVVLFMAGLLVYVAANPGYGRMSVRRQPGGVTEVQVAAPIKDLEYLLRSLETDSPAQEIIFTLPADSTFIMLGEPRLVRETEYNRRGR